MWLDRFTAQSTQSTASAGSPGRSYTPLSRRPTPTPPNRPGLTPRTSSLGALVAESAEKLPPAARLQNGSSLRQELSQTATSDPLAVLRSLIGADLAQDDQELTVVDVDFGGCSLEEYAKTTPETAEDDVVGSLEGEKDKFQDLHQSISSCDTVLGEVEKYLASFRADLAAVAAEIESLQQRSTNLNAKLESRKSLEKLLGPEVDGLIVPPAIVRKIVTGPMDDAWIKALDEFERRRKIVNAKTADGNVRAVQDVHSIMDAVADKATERIRDHLIAQIRAIRSPHINAQVLQQTQMVRFRNAFAFLAERQPQLGEGLEQAYSNTMRWYYLSNFTNYRAAIEKLKLHEVNDTIIADAVRSAKTALPHDAFSLGRRAEVLHSTNPALSSYLAEESKGAQYLELAFRTFNLALIDNASAEYAFLTEFLHKQPIKHTTRLFADMWQPVFSLGQDVAKHLVEHSHDAIGVLICIRLNQKFAFDLQKRKIAPAESYTNAMSMVLWPAYQLILDRHCEALRKLTASLSGKPTSAMLSLASSPNAISATAPHSLTPRIANFAHAIMTLSSEAGDDEPTSTSLHRLLGLYEAFLLKFSKGIADARKRDRFLHNNYSLVCTILADTPGKMAVEIRDRFGELRDDLGNLT